MCWRPSSRPLSVPADCGTALMAASMPGAVPGFGRFSGAVVGALRVHVVGSVSRRRCGYPFRRGTPAAPYANSLRNLFNIIVIVSRRRAIQARLQEKWVIMFNRVFYSPARFPCSRAALRTIAPALCASGCGWRSATTPKGSSSAVRAAVLRAFVTEVFAPSLLLPASRQSGHLPPRGNSTVLRSPLRRATDHSRPHGCTAGRLRRPLPCRTSHFTSHFTPQKLSTSHFTSHFTPQKLSTSQFTSHFTPQKLSTSQFMSHFTPQKPLPTINPHVNCIYPYKCYTVRTNKQ